MYKQKLDNKGQILLVASYMSNITEKTQTTITDLLKKERDFLINKI